MISYNELFEKKKKEKVVVFTFGRFQPPTSGHQVLIDKVSSIASRVGGAAMVFPSPAESGKINPLSHKDKVSFMKKTFRKVTVVNDKTIINPFYALKKFSDQGYTKVILVVGSDRVAEFKKTVTPYLFHKNPKLALNFEFEVMSAGERDPDSSGVSGVSGTKVREFASDGDYDSFKGSMPSGASDREVKKIFDSLRKSMGIKESTISFGDLEKQNKIKPTIVVLTKQIDDNLSGTAAKMEKSCKKYGIPFYPILTDQAYVADEDSTKRTVIIHNYDGENRKVKLDLASVIVFVRGSAITTHGGLGLMQIFEQAGSFVINSAESMKFCQNKLATALSFERNGIASPRTAFVNNESSIDIAHEKIGGKFPIVIKTLTGAEGIGVSKVDSYESLKSVLQSLWKFDAEVIIQEFMDIEYDVRTLVLNGAIIASAKRMKGPEDFRTNKALGSKTKPHKLSDKEIEFVKNVAKMSGCYFCGVDHILVNGKLYALEINGSPGVGMDKYQAYYEKNSIKGVASGQEIVNHIVYYIKDKENWSFTSKDVGYVEYVTIEGKKLKAKLDTGNGSVNSVHAENVKIKGKNVTFDLFGKHTMTKPYHDIVNIHVGAGERRKRHVIKIDMEINGITYKDVDFSLADRKENVYPVLLGKKFLQALNYSVNVNKKFSLKEDVQLLREPEILDRLVQQLMAKGMSKKQAFATATSQLQKNGVLKNGSQELTQKGKKRNSMSAGERAKDRAAKKDGKKPSEYSYNKKTNIATLSDDVNYSFEDIIEKDRDYKKEYDKYHSKPEQRANRSKRVLARRQLEKDGRVCKGDGKDVDHKDGNPQNNSDGNLRVMSANKNRGRDNNKWRKG